MGWPFFLVKYYFLILTWLFTVCTRCIHLIYLNYFSLNFPTTRQNVYSRIYVLYVHTGLRRIMLVGLTANRLLITVIRGESSIFEWSIVGNGATGYRYQFKSFSNEEPALIVTFLWTPFEKKEKENNTNRNIRGLKDNVIFMLLKTRLKYCNPRWRDGT